MEMIEQIKGAIAKLDTASKTKPIKIISHNDTDGITAAAIMGRALARWNKQFSLDIVKNLEKNYIQDLPDNQTLIFLDLASSNIDTIAQKNTESIILDHHQIPSQQSTPQNITLINPHQSNHENIASSALAYLFAKELSEQNKDLANLAVIGMIGDRFDEHINKTYETILKDAEVTIKKGLLLYPATRPLDRVLEHSYSYYIPDVTGSFGGTLRLLQEAGIHKTEQGFKSIAQLTEEEMKNLNTAIMLKRLGQTDSEELIGNIYLAKIDNTREDARELSATINAASRMDNPEIALAFCLGNKEAKKEAEKLYVKYKKTIAQALTNISEQETITGTDHIIINTKDTMKDTIIGTIASILSYSQNYAKGTIIVILGHTPENKIKVSARIAGRTDKDVASLLQKATQDLTNAEVGGHAQAAGCILEQGDEEKFINNVKNLFQKHEARIGS